MTTHNQLIAIMLSETEARDPGGWGRLHVRAWDGRTVRRGMGHSVARLLEAYADYADSAFHVYEQRLGDDSLLRWADGLRAVRTLLNGELDGLHAPAVELLIQEMLRLEGIGRVSDA